MVSLLGIRIGPGAAILPKDVKRIHMEFAVKQNDGHLGPRKFWREHLPRLKYHNPAVAMTVSQTTDQSGPATMTIFYTSSSTITVPSTSTLPNNAPQERTVSIDMKHIPASEILSRLSRLTGLETIRATPEEEAMLQNMEEDAKVRQADAKRSVIQQEQRRREADMLRQAKGEMVGQA
ncbi:hypothetical protein FGG08_001076 [Glutinoglossum americanum]|uniref:Ribosomal protein/NADH dehydrogenase domain-containing protein n=1 Tax=Glutinoglossum americanum TaxID=1670608 RepID=A0A9P8I915_9PEZI|nr:hypothetical protein FGG08_001076 [Glutinoglossum americanum]